MTDIQENSDRGGRQLPSLPEGQGTFFEKGFSPRLRELFRGSARKDATNVMSGFALKDWRIERTLGIAHVAVGSSALVFHLGARSENDAFLEASTPHGRFALPRTHWVAQDLKRRLAQRLALLADGYLDQGQKIFDTLVKEALTGSARVWSVDPFKSFSPNPVRHDLSHGSPSDQFVQRIVAYSEIDESFQAELLNITYFGVRPPQQAMMQWDEAMRLRGLGGGATGFPSVAPGPFRDDTLMLSIRHTTISRLAQAMSIEEPVIFAAGRTNPGLVRAVWNSSALERLMPRFAEQG